uniref:1-deoxy-D-xylulose 5-phosphate reductoisomerase n=1 Tax=Aquisalinus luteolus TaxID=1566827 RepID=A0A8J3EQV1_9PROT|nr:1-deoxy-D-xylulose-5-phosphate reductoisomerase [Aquisalinus luteolus]GGH96269.1 1-deoxy-D-xylulose 5-phosphate reductoisomerase [Aquisalinus luteolus]
MSATDHAISLQSTKSASLPRGLKRRVTILGSTGSVGTNTLDLIDHATARNEAEITVVALTAHSKVDMLAEQAVRYHAEFVAVADESRHEELKQRLAGTGIATGAGMSGLIEAASRDADWVMAAIVGAGGLEPTLAAARRGADIAFANKECLVCAGELFMDAMAKGGGQLLPVDSEHNAIFQVYDFDRPHRITRLILTASGGPFRTQSLEEMASVTPEEAVAHPNWTMGAKISVDSATMMNKGLELIEAARLFPTPHEKIEIIVHPQSVIHSMVEYVDGSILAQLGSPDMRTPIACAMAWPDRLDSPSPKLDLMAMGALEFEAPDTERFPALRLAREALDADGYCPAVLNAANEVAVAAFLNGHLKFLDITRVTEQVLATCTARIGASGREGLSLENLLAADSMARAEAQAVVAGLNC